MKTDAHAHFDALSRVDPEFLARYRAVPALAVSSVHDPESLEYNEAMLSSGAAFLISYGVHPQYIRPGLEDPLIDLKSGNRTASRAFVAVGECGFDFFGDTPERVRNSGNERAQRQIFELQLSFAQSNLLPMVIHARRAMDVIFSYTARLKRLPAVIFHSWTSPSNEMEALVKRGINAYFSFGASIVNGNKKSRACCAKVSGERLLLETDAPWQPPSGAKICTLEHIGVVMDECARLREVHPRMIEEIVERNFRTVYGL